MASEQKQSIPSFYPDIVVQILFTLKGWMGKSETAI